MDLFDLVAKISLDTASYENDLSNAQQKTSSFANSLGSGLKTAGGVAVAGIAAAGAAIAAVGKAMADGISETASYADHIDKMSQKIGISAQAYQEWAFVAEHSGTNVDSLQTTMKTLANAAQDNKDAFHQLGITFRDAERMSQEDLFATVIEKLQGMEEGSERTALASELLGRSATELAPLLNMTAEETAAMRQQVHDLGGVLSDEAVKAGAAFEDSLTNIKTALSGAKYGILSEFLPSVTEVMDGLTAIFGGNDSGIEQISEGVGKFTDTLAKKIPIVLQAASKIAQSIGTAIIKNIPTIISAGSQVIGELVSAILDNLPMIAGVAIEVILTLANGLSDSLPEMIPQIVDVIMSIVQILIENAPLLLTAGVEIMMAIIQGIVNAIPDLIKSAGELPALIFQAIADAIPIILDAGVDIVNKVLEGIVSAWETLKSCGHDIIAGILEGLVEVWNTVVEWFQNAVASLKGNAVIGITTVGGDGNADHSGIHPTRMYASGLERVPYDGFIAGLHKDEMVLDRNEADAYRRGIGGGNGSTVNLYAQTIDEATIDYLIQRVNTGLVGA